MQSDRLCRIHHTVLGLVLLVSLSSNIFAERVTLKNAIVHTVSSNDLSKATVILNNGKIESVSTADPAAADKTIDLKGLHLYPGLIALNTALGLSEISGVRSTRDLAEVGDYTPDVQSWIAVSPDSELIPVARANGVACIEPAPQGGIIAGQSGLVVLDGWTTEEMAIKKPAALHVYWPEMDLDTTPKDQFKDKAKWKSLEDQARERQDKLRALDDFLAEARAYARAKAVAGADFETNPPWEAMLPYLSGELPFMIHADDVRQIKGAVQWSQTNKLKMILVGGREASRVSALLAEKKIPVLFEHTFTQPVRDTESYDIYFKTPELLRKAGVQFAIGMGATAFDAALIKNLPYCAAQSVAFGLPPEEALKSITLYPARMVGVSDRFGSIEPGKEATLVACDGDLLDIRTHVKRMWIAGKEVSLETRHTRLYEKYKNRPKMK